MAADGRNSTFLSDLSLAIARKRLAGTTDPIARIATEVGYAFEGALSKAIMRKYGIRPGALRLAGPNIGASTQEDSAAL